MSGHNTGAGVAVRRGSSNSDARGSSENRRRRRAWLVATYRADVDLYVPDAAPHAPYPVTFVSAEHPEPGVAVPACRCYRCGRLLTEDTVTVDRIIPGCQGGTYRRDNIRPACGDCNSETGGKLGASRRGK